MLAVAVVGLAQRALLVKSTRTTSLLAVNSVVVNVVLADAAPWLVPLINHSYIGAAPPLVGTAVNVVEPFVQIEVGDADTATAGTNTGLTVMTTPVEVAVVGLAQLAVLVITTS
jgi:hypothetical protein